MRESLQRGAVLAYVLVLWLAAWPFPSSPVLGSAKLAAERALRSVGLVPGLEVFPGLPEESLAIHHACTEVQGYRAGVWQTLYAPDCPPEGTLLFRDPFELTIQRMMTAPKLPLLLGAMPPPDAAPEAVRHMTELLDYFCASEFEPDRVMLRWMQQFRDLGDGSYPQPEHGLLCTQKCTPGTRPRCSLRSGDAEPLAG